VSESEKISWERELISRNQSYSVSLRGLNRHESTQIDA
jgi:hypothetical protein